MMDWIHALFDKFPSKNPKNGIPILPPQKVASQTPCFIVLFVTYFHVFHQDGVSVSPKIQKNDGNFVDWLFMRFFRRLPNFSPLKN